jgi:effector-binding domain-containing protein
MPDDLDIHVTTVGEMPTAVVRSTITWPELAITIKASLDQVFALLAAPDAPVTQAGDIVALYLDTTPTMEIGVVVSGPFDASGPVVASVLPAGTTATTVHRGDYDGLSATGAAVIAWCAQHGHERAGPSWELYGDWHEDPAQMETQVHHLLR